MTYIKNMERERKIQKNARPNPKDSLTDGVARSWAAVAAQALATKLETKKEESFRGRKLKELVVKVEDKYKWEQSKTMLAEHILQKIQSPKHAKTSQFVAARQLQSGNILL